MTCASFLMSTTGLNPPGMPLGMTLTWDVSCKGAPNPSACTYTSYQSGGTRYNHTCYYACAVRNSACSAKYWTQASTGLCMQVLTLGLYKGIFSVPMLTLWPCGKCGQIFLEQLVVWISTGGPGRVLGVMGMVVGMRTVNDYVVYPSARVNS